MRTKYGSLIRTLGLSCSLLLATAVNAGEGSFGWVTTLDLQPKGTWEFEQRVQLARGHEGKYDLWQARTELEYGLSNDIQLAAYLNTSSVYASQNYADGSTAGWGVPGSAADSSSYRRSRVDGVSLEGIWRITNPVTSPIGFGIYIEPTFGPVKDAFETRLLVQSNFIDDRLVLAANLVYEIEKIKFDHAELARETVLDLVWGFNYRFASRWTAGLEHRFHNDFDGYHFNKQTQRAHFVGPNIHYAAKDWWITAAWRKQIGGQCWAPGDAECSGGKVWDSHGKNEYIVKIGIPF